MVDFVDLILTRADFFFFCTFFSIFFFISIKIQIKKNLIKKFFIRTTYKGITINMHAHKIISNSC